MVWRGVVRVQAIATTTSLGDEDGLCRTTDVVRQSPGQAHADIGRSGEKEGAPHPYPSWAV